VDVHAELAQDAPHSGGRGMWSRHFDNFVLQICQICSTKITIGNLGFEWSQEGVLGLWHPS
jgi:hypothetical protein